MASRWIEAVRWWWLQRQIKAGKYYDPITERRRRNRAARYDVD